MPHNKIRRYSARKMLQATTEELFQNLSGDFVLVFDDGEMTVSARSTMFSSYAWDLIRAYPLTPILKKHHCATVTDASPFGSGTHIKLLNNIIWDVHDTYRKAGQAVNMMELGRMVYEITNNIYNDMILKTEDSVVSLDILDFIEIMEYPKVKEVLDNPQETPEFVENSYRVLKEALRRTPELMNNNLSKAVRAGLVREGQTLQTLGARGFVTDVDSHLFKFPITRGFAKGLRSFSDALIESRSSAKSLISNKVLISDAEYFSRRLQILTQIVETLHQGDCGSTHYLRWKVRDKEIDNTGKVLRPSDLETLQGKYFLDDSTGTLKILKSSDTQYLGKILKFRSPIAGCKHPDPNGICATCFGDLSLSVPKGTNLGHLCAAIMTQQANQNILSTKHYLTGTYMVGSIRIPPEFKDYIGLSPSGNGYVFQKSLKDKENYMILLAANVPGLVDLSSVDSVEELGLSHVSEITSMGFRSIHKNGQEDKEIISLAVDRRKASFTYPMLEHIKKVGWSFDDAGDYVISLDGWDYDKVALKLPMRQYNMSDHAKAISIAIESSQERLKERDGNQTPEDALIELSDLVNSKLDVNIALLEVILLGSLIRSTVDRDFFMPKEGTKKEMSVAPNTIANRSLSATLAYNAMAQKIVDPAALFHERRPQLVMDVFIKPQETLTDPYRYERYYKDS